MKLADVRLVTLRCRDCGAEVILEEDVNECECGSLFIREWKFDNHAGAVIELWRFISVGKPNRRRNE